MNPSLSTVDSLMNVLPHPNTNLNLLPNSLQRAINQNATTNNSRLNSIELDRAFKARSSPSFNDSEPPSYFEVVGSAGFTSVHLQETAAVTTARAQSPTNHHDNNSANNRYSSHVPVNFRNQQNNQNRLLNNVNNTNSKEFTNIANPNNNNISSNRTTRNLNLATSIYQQNDQDHNGRTTTIVDAASTYSTTSGRQRASQAAYHHHRQHHHKPSETYMVWSILTTFYCVFIGIFALILSLQVRSLNRRGLFEKAYARSRAVWYLNIAGLFFGIVYLAVGILFCLLPRF